MEPDEINTMKYVVISRAEYDALVEQSICLDLIASSVGRYGVDDNICDAVFTHLGRKTRHDIEAQCKAEDKDA